MFSKEKTITQKECDALLQKQREECEKVIISLKSQNAELKQEVDSLTAQNNQHRAEEGKVKDALVAAVDKAKSIENEGKRFYEAQLSRVKHLYAHWSQTLAAIRQKYGIESEEEKNAQRFANEVEDFLTTTIDVHLKRETKKQESRSHEGTEKIYHKQLLSRMSGLLNSVSPRNLNELPPQPEIVLPLPKLFEHKEVQAMQLRRVAAHAESLSPHEPKLPPKQEPASSSDAAEWKKREDARLAKTELKQSSEATTAKPLITSQKPAQTSTYAAVMQKYIGEDENAESEVTATTYTKEAAATTASVNVFAKTQSKSSSGFDLKEAINPKESLEDILKEFNFDD